MRSNSNKSSDLETVQRTFTGHMRDPDGQAAPEGIDDRRLQIYRDLIYNNIQGFLANSFPVIRKLMNDKDWHAMLRDYVAHHQAQTPLFPKMPQEFLKYLEQDPDRVPKTYPYLAELAHYEWLETSISMDTREIVTDDVEETGDLLAGIPVLNPVAVPVAYQWPVHKIGPDFMPTAMPEMQTFLIVFRKPDYQVGFMELNQLSARLVEKIAGNTEKTGRILLLEICQEINHPDQTVVVNGGAEIMNSMRDKSVLLGTKKKGDV